MPQSHVPNDRAARTELLSAIGWEVRALGEAQLRSLTAMQRCIEDFRKTDDAKAAEGVRRHISELEERSPQVFEALRFLTRVLDELAPPSPSGPSTS